MTENTGLSVHVLLFTIYMGIDKLIFRHQKNDNKLFFCINPGKFFDCVSVSDICNVCNVGQHHVYNFIYHISML